MLAPTTLQKTQLSLFQTFYGNSDHERLSNIIEIWDAAPKYITPCRASSSKVALMDFLERDFDCKGKTFHMRVAPAAIPSEDGKRIDMFPTAREEIVEDALRKMAIQQRLGFVGSMLDEPIFGVKFSLNMLRKELARHGRSMPYRDIVQSLLIMSGCQVDITCDGRRALSRAPILAGIETVSRDDYLSDPGSLWSARFHPMVASSLGSIAYRQFDYDTTMKYRSGIARWLHKQLVAVYLNAGLAQPFHTSLSVIRSQSGLLNYSRQRDQAWAMQDAINELQSGDHPIVRQIDAKAVLEGRKIVDMRYILHPTAQFIAQVKAANARQRDWADNLKGASAQAAPPARR